MGNPCVVEHCPATIFCAYFYIIICNYIYLKISALTFMLLHRKKKKGIEPVHADKQSLDDGELN